MNKRKNNHRGGSVADIARLDFHDHFGNLFDRTRAKVSEKEKGVMMVDKIKNRFGISELDEQRFRQKMMDWQEDAMTPNEEPEGESIEEKEKERDRRIVKWTRDERGGIISPFDKKAKEDREALDKEIDEKKTKPLKPWKM